jgi:hypothetical protein
VTSCLVGGFNHLEKYEFVNGKDYLIPYISYIMENIKCSKPPTSCDNIANRIAKAGAFHAWPWNAPQKSPIDPVDPINSICRWNDHPMIFQCWMMLDAFLLQLGNMSTLEQALLLKRLKDIESHDMKNMNSCSETLESASRNGSMRISCACQYWIMTPPEVGRALFGHLNECC